MSRKVFLLSPASTSGRRAQLLFNERAEFALAVALRSDGGATVAEVFSFLSGLYFRGKLAYAHAFARPAGGGRAIQVITPDRGFMDPNARIGLAELRAFAASPIDAGNAVYRDALGRDARALAAELPEPSAVILLGSIASNKYVDILLSVFGEQLLFPAEFVGRGDMSRGGLLLRCVDNGSELTYVPVAGTIRHGKRPPKLDPR